MVEATVLRTSIEVNSTELHSVLSWLSEKGWKPAIFDTDKAFMQMTNLGDELDFFEFRQSLRFHLEFFPFTVGDVFFRDSDSVYYLVTITDSVFPPPDVDDYGLFFDSDVDQTPILEIGVISTTSNGLKNRLRDFANFVESAMKVSVQHQQDREKRLEWVEYTTPQLDRIRLFIDGKFVIPKLISEEIKASNILVSKLAREIVITLSKTRSLPEDNIPNHSRKSQGQVKKALDALSDSNLILEERGEYSVSDLGKHMITGSYWMTVWITEMLIRLGVPRQAILWSVSEHGEEVDLLMEFFEHLWVVELKDKEFGAGPARSLNYRQKHYGATKSFVISTAKVSTDAKRVFRTLQGYEDPLYVEGLENAEDTLRNEFSIASLEHIARRLRMIGEIPRYDLRTMLQARFGESNLPVPMKIEYY